MYLLNLDCGHAKNTAGKKAPDGSFYEWEFNNDMQYRIKKRCEEHGITVFLTNPNPSTVLDIGLTARATLANNYWSSKGKPSSLFLSIHANAYGADFNSARGTETFVASNASANSKNAAKYVNTEISNTFASLDSGAKNRGVKTENFTVIYKALTPSILVEYGFYTNQSDLKILKNNRDKLCEATVKGVCAYFNITYKPLGVSQIVSYLVTVNTDILNVRSGPNTSYSVVEQIKKGEVYTIIEEKDGWGKLKSGVGWISLSYVFKK